MSHRKCYSYRLYIKFLPLRCTVCITLCPPSSDVMRCGWMEVTFQGLEADFLWFDLSWNSSCICLVILICVFESQLALAQYQASSFLKFNKVFLKELKQIEWNIVIGNLTNCSNFKECPKSWLIHAVFSHQTNEIIFILKVRKCFRIGCMSYDFHWGLHKSQYNLKQWQSNEPWHITGRLKIDLHKSFFFFF